jgi:hypothetical protein
VSDLIQAELCAKLSGEIKTGRKMASNAIKVFIKVRPLINRETTDNATSVWNVVGNTLKSTDKQYEMAFGECLS